MELRELLKKEMVKLYGNSFDPSDIDTMPDSDVEQMCKDMNIYANIKLAKPKPAPASKQQVIKAEAKKPFDPIAAAEACIKPRQKAEPKKQEQTVLKFTDTPCKWKRTIVSEMSAETERAVTAEMESHGGKRIGFGVYEFDRNPETLF